MIGLELLKSIYEIFIEIAPYMILGLFFVGLLHIFFSKEFIIKHVGKDNTASVIKSSVLGVPLPLCSCGVIPTAVYMAKNGASKGAVVSFLISTPQTGLDSILVTYGMLGWVFAIYRPIVAFISG
ncbi:MAG: permease, partial [Candidatus Delongbacteria bacterium]|nr:permease [Candidatus Delongbacteria bacterium]